MDGEELGLEVETPVVSETDKGAMDEILDFFDGPINVEGEKKPEVVPPVVKEEIEKVVNEEIPAKEEEKIEIPEVKEEKKEEEVDERDDIIAQLRAELNRATANKVRDEKEQLFPAKEPEKPVEKVVEEPPKRETKPLNERFRNIYEKKEFLSKEQLDKLIDNPELINEAIHSSRTELLDTLLEVIPDVVNIAVNREVMVAKAVSSFYDKNQDLKEYSNYVQSVLREVEEKHRGKGTTYNEVFAETATECRKRLHLKEPKEVKDAQVDLKKPAFAGNKAGTATPISKDNKSGRMFSTEAEELMDLNL